MTSSLSRDRRLWFAAVITGMVTVSAQLSDDCPLGWEKFNDHCYNFVFYPVLNYRMAASTCQVDGAYLLSINNNEEHEFVSQWLTDNDMDRASQWWTSGIGVGQQLRWEGDGTANSLDDPTKWVGEDVRQQGHLHVVYKFTTLTNTYLWSRQYPDISSPYVCEISLLQSFRIYQALRDHTFGTDLTDPGKVPHGPRFTIDPQSLVVVGRMKTAFLECAAISIPPAAYTWYKVTGDGLLTISTDMDSRYSLTNGRFAFQQPSQTLDAGDYFCVAYNDFGTIRSHTVTVSFGYLGEFSNDPPGAVGANQYQGTYLDCNPPRYNPEIRYQWYKGPNADFLRTDLNQYQFVSDNGRLYLSETHLADAGMYHCVVTLSAPLGQTTATVQPPSGTSLGIELIIRGDTATEFGPIIHNDFPVAFPTPALREVNLRVECFAYGRLPMVYSWRRDNGPIPKKALYQDSDRVLVLPNAQLEDSGNYTCRVERGTRAWDEKTLSIVVEAVPFFVFPLRDQHVDVDSTFSIHCQAMGVPLPRYAWFKDAEPLTSIPGDVEVRGNVVTFTRANAKRHNGMYQCSATNIYGTRMSSAQVRVLEFQPSFNKRPVEPSQLATIGGNVTIVCQPEAAPAPTFIWYQNDRDLGLTVGVEGRVMLLGNGNLLITQVQASDQGEYTCTATNSLGSASSSGLLMVVARTTISTVPQNTQVQVNQSAFLSCQASVDQRHHDLAYVWAFNGHPIDIAKRPEYRQTTNAGLYGLHVINVQFEHEGWYECNAVTVGDKVSAAAFLTVRGPPSEPAGLHGRNDGSEVILTWTDGKAHGSNIVFYIIQHKSDFFPVWRVKAKDIPVSDVIDEKHPDKRTYRLTDFSPGSSYTFRIHAVNAFGVGSASLPSVFFKIPDAPPRKAPDGIRETFSTVGTLAVAWDPLNPEDLTGERRGYRLYWRRKNKVIVSDSLWQTDTVDDDGTNMFYTLIGGEFYYLEYEVKMAAFNSLGQGPNSSVVVLMSQPDMPRAVPQNVWGEDYNATAVMVYWDPVDASREVMRGLLMGFQVNYWWEKDPGYIASSNVHCVDCVEAMVLGLTPNEDYWVNVQVFTVAGLGPPGEDYRISTVLNPPLLYPEYVSVASMEGRHVFVSWRGVPIGLVEEPLHGYKLHWWPATENMLTANETVVPGKYHTWGVIEGVQDGIVYALRVSGYNNGGDGKKSPTVYFTLEGQVVYNFETTEILATGTDIRASLWILGISCLAHCLLFIELA